MLKRPFTNPFFIIFFCFLLVFALFSVFEFVPSVKGVPDWTTPNSIEDFCGDNSGVRVGQSIDDNTGTWWQHSSYCYHWVIFDMGETMTITQIRLFQISTTSMRWGLSAGLYVYVSDDVGDWGDAVWEGVFNAYGWQESGTFEKDGRFIKLVSKADHYNQRMPEFDAYAETEGGYALNLRVMDFDLTDTISGAIVYKDTDTLTSDANGWANWTEVSGTVDVKVEYFGFWVNGTFQVVVDEDKTIDVKCNLYDVTITVKPNNEQGVISGANVTAYNNTGTSIGNIKSGVTVDATGQVTLTNLPNATIRFIIYAKSDFSIVIANTTKALTSDGQSENITANQNYIDLQLSWGLTVIPVGLIVLFKKRRTKGVLT